MKSSTLNYQLMRSAFGASMFNDQQMLSNLDLISV